MTSTAKAVADYAGITRSSSSSLFALAAPIVLGYFGRLMRSDHLDANGLATRLQGERLALAGAIPTGLGALLPSFAGIGDTTSRTVTAGVNRVADVTRHVAVPEPRRSAGWLIPVLIGIAALGGLLWLMGRGRVAEQARTGAAEVTRAGVGATSAAVNLLTRMLPNNLSVRLPEGSMEDRLASYLSLQTARPGQSFDFDRIGFETGSASLTAASREQLSNVATILKAYPEAQVGVAGYTDNVGDATTNLNLSRARAEAVSTALTSMGVGSDRIQSAGYGSQNPIADNSSEEGRARNRRVNLTVTRR
jgi:outer membrane protein OmpA-like peptidoglycan-associated protein